MVLGTRSLKLKGSSHTGWGLGLRKESSKTSPFPSTEAIAWLNTRFLWLSEMPLCAVLCLSHSSF